MLLELIMWKMVPYLSSYDLVSHACPSGTSYTAVLVGITATIGWLFSSRVQIINATKTHAMQALMNSRNSTIYVEQVDIATKIRREVKAKEQECLLIEDYKELTSEQVSAIHYLLNFLEFIAAGVKHHNLDEDLIKSSLRGILAANYNLFEKVIEHLRADNKNTYIYLEELQRRWNPKEPAETCEQPKLKSKKLLIFLNIMSLYFPHTVNKCVCFYNQKINN